MFNFQGSELIIILLLALVVLGPEKLPEAMRRLGRFAADLKKMSSGFQEEFRAAVDEPTRELRDTANTLRDSLDFRKLQDGERAEKPKSAEMAAATPEAAPDEPAVDAVDAVDATEPTDERHTAFTDQTSTPPAPPPPFSSSQRSSAAPKPAPAPQVAVDDEHGLREARPVDQDGAA